MSLQLVSGRHCDGFKVSTATPGFKQSFKNTNAHLRQAEINYENSQERRAKSVAELKSLKQRHIPTRQKGHLAVIGRARLLLDETSSFKTSTENQQSVASSRPCLHSSGKLLFNE